MNQISNYSAWIKSSFLLASYFLLTIPCQAQGNWSYNLLNEHKTEMDIAVVGNKIFFYSGYKRVGNTTVSVQELELFDVRTGSKTSKTLIGEDIRVKMATVTSGSKVYFAGGYNYDNIGFYSKKVSIYDTLNDQWTSEELSKGRTLFAAAASNNKVMFGGGFGTDEPNSFSRIVNIYDENTQLWKDTILPSKPFALGPPYDTGSRSDLTAASIGDKIFFAGGNYTGSLFLDMVNIYDTQQKKWVYATLSQKKSRLKSVVYQSKIYFVGGVLKSNMPSDTIDIYNSINDSWSVLKIPHLFKRVYDGVPREYVQAAQAGCKLFLLPIQNGSGSVPHNPAKSSRDSVAIYDLARNTWSYLGLPQAIFGTTLAAAENKIYFAGGSEVATGLYTDLISILTLEPKLQTSIDDTETTAYNFGHVLLGESKDKEVSISNEGDYELLFANIPSRVSVSGDLDDFSIDLSSLELKDTLSPAEIISLPIHFSPTGMGLKQVTLTVYSNDPAHPAYTFTVQGTGTDVTSVQDLAFSNSLNVYPNPTTGLLQVASKTGEELYVEILNTQGNRVKEVQYINNNETIDLSFLTEGLYFLKIANASSSTVAKVIKK